MPHIRPPGEATIYGFTISVAGKSWPWGTQLPDILASTGPGPGWHFWKERRCCSYRLPAEKPKSPAGTVGGRGTGHRANSHSLRVEGFPRSTPRSFRLLYFPERESEGIRAASRESGRIFPKLGGSVAGHFAGRTKTLVDFGQYAR
jgi:hypothetical protein